MLILITVELLLFNNLDIAIAKDNISESTLLKLVNQERKNNKIEPLRLNQKLIQASINKAKDLIKNEYFENTSKDGRVFSEFIKETGYQYNYIGENLAVNFKNNESIIKAWLESPSHRDNLLNEAFIETGISVQTYQNRTIIVQIFGRPNNIDPISLEKKIGNHFSEILILYIDQKEAGSLNNNSLS